MSPLIIFIGFHYLIVFNYLQKLLESPVNTQLKQNMHETEF